MELLRVGAWWEEVKSLGDVPQGDLGTSGAFLSVPGGEQIPLLCAAAVIHCTTTGPINKGR